jgi:hypothetical protein
MTTCNSSLIQAFEYDDNAWILTLVFKSNGDVRTYPDFPPEMYSEFEASDSKGKFYNAKIKGHFKDVLKVGRVTPEEVAEEAAKTVKTGYVPSAQDRHEDALTANEQMGITDADIRNVDPNWKGDATVADDLITHDEQEALAEPGRKQPQVDKLTKQWTALVPVPTAIVVVRDKSHYVQISDTLKKKTGIRDTVFSLLDPARDAVYKAYKAIADRQKSILDPMDASIKADKNALTAWDNEQRRLAAVESERLRKVAEAAAAIEQQKRTEELRLQIASEQAEAGDPEQAQMTLLDETIVAPPMPVYAPRVEVETPKVEGQSFRDNWSARVTDFGLLVKDVAAGIECYEKTGSLQGHAPSGVLTFSQAQLNQLAKASKSMLSIPGVQAENNRVMTQRKG